MKRNVYRTAVLMAALLAVTWTVATQTAQAVATIVINNLDSPGEGYNDPTPFTPVGGNPATTLGQARLIAIQHAATMWGSRLTSNVTITVNAKFDPMFCTATQAILGGAGTIIILRDFPNAPVANTWYPQALANSKATFDLDPANADIVATFNSDVDLPGCLTAANWYYGLDAKPPGSDIDFVSVVFHELCHGLGFYTLIGPTGAKFMGFDDAYMRHLERHYPLPPVLWPAMTDAQRAAAAIAGDANVHWIGPIVIANSGVLTAGVGPAGHVWIYAPSSWESGSSISHWSKLAFPNQLMEPSYTGPNHSPGLALQLLQDIGWTLQAMNGTDVVFILDATGSTRNLIPKWIAQIPTIALAWKAFDNNARFAIASHTDYPFNGYGSPLPLPGDYAYHRESQFDADPANLQLVLDGIPDNLIGGDDPESQYEAIYQVITGEGRDLTAPPTNFSDPGEYPAQPLGKLYPMVIYHFTWPLQFHNRDLESNYPISGPCTQRPDCVPGRTATLAEIAKWSGWNMFFGLTFISPPGQSAGKRVGQRSDPQADGAEDGEGWAASDSLLQELAFYSGGHVYAVGDTLQFLQAAIDSSIQRWATSPQGGHDADGDGLADSVDNCPYAGNANQHDSDGDGVGDSCDNCISTPNADQTDGNYNGIGDVCECSCPHQGDINGDGVIDVFDVIDVIGIAFSGGTDPKDPACPKTRGDVDNDGDTDVFDVIYLIATAFSGGPNPVDPCP